MGDDGACGREAGRRRAADVRLDGAVIDAVGPASTSAAAAPTTVDLTGYVLLPAAVEPHAHLDKAFLADSWRTRPVTCSARSRR